MKSLRTPLSTKVAGLTTLIIGIIGLLIGYLVYTNTSSALRDSIGTLQSETTKQNMDKIDRYLYERGVDIQLLSDRNLVQQYLAQSSSVTTDNNLQLSKQLQRVKQISGSWRDISIINTTNQPVLTTDDPESIKMLMQQPEFTTAYSKAISGTVSYSDLFIEKSENLPVMLVMSPIHNYSDPSKAIVGVTAGEIAWPSVLEILQSIKGPQAELLNSHGISLGDSNISEAGSILRENRSASKAYTLMQKKDSGTALLSGLDDPNNIYLTSYYKEKGYLNYEGNGWLLALETPKAVAFKSAESITKKLLIYIVIFLIILSLVQVLVFRKVIVQPILELKDISTRLASGDFSLRTTKLSNDELGDLGQVFNDMADKLQTAYNILKSSAKEAQNEKNILKILLDNLPVGVLVVKAPGGEPIMMNRSGEIISGRGISADINSGNYQQAYQVFKEDGSIYPTEQLPLTITLKTGKVAMKDDMVMQKPDGTKVTVRAITTPIKDFDGVIRRAVSVFEDISKDRQLERSREEFFSIASHELRTPLTAIRGNSDLIQQYYGDKLDDPDLKEMVSDIHESANRLIAIVNDFLDTSRLEQKRMKFESAAIDVAELAKAVVKEYQVTGSRQKVHLHIDMPASPLPKAWADSNRTKQVLINLVGNALKFTDNGSVTISLKESGHDIKIFISDTGKGMSPEAQQLLFRKFEQTSTSILTRDSVRGTGLGLYISKMIVEQMHGEIKLEHSEVGKGTTFSFSLPIADGNQKPEPSHPDIHRGAIK